MLWFAWVGICKLIAAASFDFDSLWCLCCWKCILFPFASSPRWAGLWPSWNNKSPSCGGTRDWRCICWLVVFGLVFWRCQIQNTLVARIIFTKKLLANKRTNKSFNWNHIYLNYTIIWRLLLSCWNRLVRLLSCSILVALNWAVEGRPLVVEGSPLIPDAIHAAW